MTASALSLQAVEGGGKAALARALAELERRPDAPESLAFLDQVFAAARAHVVGLTGPPGVGKSTLLSALIAVCRDRGRTVGVIAVDPSSRRSGGALLGDRFRLTVDPDDSGSFVRSMAARDRLGGLAHETLAAMVLLRAVFDLVFIETVGVGQSEADVAMAADTVVFCAQPGSGDSVQFMKAGIVEVPHIAVVTKADTGAAARRALADLAGAMDLAAAEGGWDRPVLPVAARTGAGVEQLLDAVDAHWDWLGEAGRLDEARHCQAQMWLREAVRDQFGRNGLRQAGALFLARDVSPFGETARVASALMSERPTHIADPSDQNGVP